MIAHPAYSIYCAYDIVKYHEFCLENNLDLWWCDLIHPWDLDIRKYPLEYRQRAIAEIDKVFEMYHSKPDYLHGPARQTLLKYRVQLNSVVDTEFKPDPLGFHSSSEGELKQPYSFLELWPEFKDYKRE